ncbi:prefoldin subunit alpha [Halobacteriales archaeon SW_7_68_16]|nr:MAG: prefoldin subunit alpha [Halobacteriales archaeon SW_7_68_16]
MNAGGGQLQELSEQLQELQQQIAAVEGEIERLEGEQSDIDDAVEAIEELDTGATVQVPLGGGAHLRAEVEDIEEIVVDLGGGYAAERDSSGAIESLEKKRTTIDDRIDGLESDVDDLEDESDELEQQARQLQQQQMQQQMGGGDE